MIKKLLIGLIFISLIAPASAGAVKEFQVDTGSTLTTGLLGYWKMEDATEFFNGYTVVNTGVTFTTGSGGKVNEAGIFDSGQGDELATTNVGLDTYGDFSVSFWIDPGTLSDAGLSINKGQGANDKSFFFQKINSNDFRMQSSANGTSYPTPIDIDDGMTTGTYFHVVVTYETSNGNFVLYVNNVNKGNGNSAAGINNSNASFDIGWDVQSWESDIDEVGFWSKILSGTEIDDLYNSGSGQTMVEVEAVAAPSQIQVVWW